LTISPKSTRLANNGFTKRNLARTQSLVVASRKFPEFGPRVAIFDDGQQRHEDLVQAWLDGAVDELLGRPAPAQVAEAKQEQLVPKDRGITPDGESFGCGARG